MRYNIFKTVHDKRLFTSIFEKKTYYANSIKIMTLTLKVTVTETHATVHISLKQTRQTRIYSYPYIETSFSLLFGIVTFKLG